MIKQHTIDAIRRESLTGYVSLFTTLKQVGGNHVGRCPLHNEKSPSFNVTNGKGFKCFGCGKGGDIVAFVMEKDNVNFHEAIKKLCDHFRIPFEEEDYERRERVRPILKVLPDKSVSFYQLFADRGITANTVDLLRIMESVEWMPKAKSEVPVIAFPYYRNGELVNVKYRAEGKDFKLVKDAELVFFNLDAMQDKDYVVITEGEIDCATVVQCATPSVISVPNGAASGSQRLDYLNNCWDLFEGKECIVIMTDNDEPGIALRDELARRLGKDRCRKVTYPADCKDANEVLMRHGAAAVAEIIKNASDFPIEGILSMDDMYEDVKNFYINGYPIGVKVGISGLDELISFMPGQMTTITGIPGSGKSEMVDFIMTQAARNHGWSFGICSFENQPSSLHVTKIMEKFTSKSFAYRYNPYHRMNMTEFDNAAVFVDRFFHFININQIEVTLQGILDKAKELVQKKGINGLLIDPWNYIEHKVPHGQTETQYISECLTAIKAFALTYGIHIFLIAHPTKLKKENKKYEVPTLYSISGSAHFFNKTDNGITVYRNFDTNIVDVYIQKIRYSWLGKIGFISFNYNLDTRQYEQL